MNDLQVHLDTLEADPHDDNALAAIDEFYCTQERWEEFVKLLDVVAHKRAGDAQVPLLRRAAELCRQHLGNESRAESYLHEALQLAPGHVACHRDLRELYFSDGQYAKGVDVGIALAEILADEGSLDEAVDELVAVAARAPTETLIWKSLEGLYRRAGNFKEAARALSERINLLGDGDERLQALLDHATLLAHEMHDGVGAVGSIRGVLTAVKDDARAIDLLESLLTLLKEQEGLRGAGELLADIYTQSGRYEDSARIYAVLVSRCGEAGYRSRYLQESANIKQKYLDDVQGAFQDVEQAFREDPTSLVALESLAELGSVTERWKELGQSYEDALNVLTSPDQRTPIERALADVLAQHLDRGQEALQYYRVSGQGGLPEDVSALRQMMNSLRQEGDPQEFASVLAALSHKTTDTEEKAAVLFELAGVYEIGLQNPKDALNAYIALVSLKPNEFETLRRVERLAQVTESHGEHLNALVALTQMGDKNPKWNQDLAALGALQTEQGDYASALRSFRTILAKYRGDAQAVLGLERLIELSDDKELLTQILEPVYVGEQKFDKLVWLLTLKLPMVVDKVERKALLRRIGDISENRLKDRDRAFEFARRSFEEDPADMGVRMWLEKVSADANKLADLAKAYVDVATKVESSLATQLSRRAASLFQDKLDDLDSAVEQYQEILKIDEKDEKALAGLELIHRSRNDDQELVDILRRRAQWTIGQERKREYFTEIAQIQSTRIGDLAGAAKTLRTLLEFTPDDRQVFSHLEELLTKDQQWDSLANCYELEEQRLAAKMGPESVEHRLDCTHKRAVVLDQHLDRRSVSVALFKGILDEVNNEEEWMEYIHKRADAGIPEFLELLVELFEERGQDQNYCEALENSLKHSSDSGQRRALYIKLSSAYEKNIAAGDLSLQALSRAYDENRGDRELVEELSRIAEKFNLHQEFVQIVGQEVEAVADPKVRQDILRRLGFVCAEHLNELGYAVAYLRHAIQYQPDDHESLAQLSRVLEKQADWPSLAQILERRAALSENGDEQKSLLMELGTIWSDRLGQHDAALRCFESTLDISPGDKIALTQQEKILRVLKRWSPLVANLIVQADVFDDASERVRALHGLAELYCGQMNEPESGIATYLQILKLSAGDAVAYRALNKLLSDHKRWDDLASLLRQQIIEAPDPAIKLELNRQLASILNEHLDRADDAVSTWKSVLIADSSNEEALRALLKIYHERADWEEFVEVAHDLIPLSQPFEAKRVRFQLAQVLGENLGQRQQSLKVIRDVRAQEPHAVDEIEALAMLALNIQAYEEATACFELAGDLHPETERKLEAYYRSAQIFEVELEAPHNAKKAYASILGIQVDEQRAFQALSKILREQESWRPLIEITEGFVLHAPKEMKIVLLRDIRDISAEQLGERDFAFIAACRAFKDSPDKNVDAEALEALGRQTDSLETAAAVLEDEVDAITSIDEKIQTLHRVARLYADDVGDVPSAEDALQNLLELDPSNQDALNKLARLGALEERYDKQIVALEKKLALLETNAEKTEILFSIARIWEDQIQEVDESVGALNRILALDGKNASALESLCRLYESEQAWGPLATTLTRRAALSTNLSEQVAIRLRVAQICEKAGADGDVVIQWYRSVLDLDGTHVDALNSLERLYTNLERWSELIQIFETLLRQRDKVGDKIDLLVKAASIHESEFSSFSDATQCYERCLTLDANNLFCIENLERLLRLDSQWIRLIDVLQHHLKQVDEPEETTDLYLEIAEINYQELSRVDKAEQSFQMARQVNPASVKALKGLGQLYERSGNWFQSLEMMRAQVDLCGPNAEALPVLMRMGRINDDMLADAESAQSSYKRALDIDPNYEPALNAMKELARRREDWNAYHEYLVAQAEHADDLEDKSELFTEAGDFLVRTREDEAGAVRFYRRALDILPQSRAPREALAEIYFNQEAFEESRGLLLGLVDELDRNADSASLVQKLCRLGYIEEKLGEEDAALDKYRMATDVDATYLPALEGLSQCLLKSEKREEAQKVLQAILIHHRSSLTGTEVADAQAQIAEISFMQGKPDLAYSQFEKTLELDAEQALALSRLAAMDIEHQRWETAYIRLSRFSEVAAAQERIQTVIQMSEIAEVHLKDLPEAIEPLERALQWGAASSAISARLGHLYAVNHQLRRAVDSYKEAIEIEKASDDRKFLGKLYFELGELYELRVKHEPNAVEAYNLALDAEPTNMDAFQRIETLLSKGREWGLLETNYRAMIVRTKNLSPRLRVVLWRALGELYRNALKNLDPAIQAYEVVVKLSPESVDDRKILADLLAKSSTRKQDAIDMYHEFVDASENPVEYLRRLRQIYHSIENVDAVYVFCSCLSFLNASDANENELLAYLVKRLPPRAIGSLDEKCWERILDPGLNCPIGKLSQELHKVSYESFQISKKQLGLKKKDASDMQSSDIYFAKILRYVSKLLNLKGTALYFLQQSVAPLMLVNIQGPALVIGKDHSLCRNPSQNRVARFQMGRILAYQRSEMFLGYAYAGEKLRDLLLGLCVAYKPDLPHDGHPGTVNGWADRFRQLPSVALKRLQPLVNPAYQDLARGEALEDYAKAVERTAMRAGLVSSGDLAQSFVALNEGPDGAFPLSVNERTQCLVRYFVSKDYSAIRRFTGVALLASQEK
jgi:golgin subfamily B member 1